LAISVSRPSTTSSTETDSVRFDDRGTSMASRFSVMPRLMERMTPSVRRPSACSASTIVSLRSAATEGR
jgi:hypothetical protein